VEHGTGGVQAPMCHALLTIRISQLWNTMSYRRVLIITFCQAARVALRRVWTSQLNGRSRHGSCLQSPGEVNTFLFCTMEGYWGVKRCSAVSMAQGVHSASEGQSLTVHIGHMRADRLTLTRSCPYKHAHHNFCEIVARTRRQMYQGPRDGACKIALDF
jgi:hypothetical protein